MPQLRNVPATNKVLERWPEIAEAMLKGENFDKIAEKYGVTRWAIWNNTRSPEFQEYFKGMMDEQMMPIFLQHAKHIEELWNSNDPRDRRHAVTEARQMYALQRGTTSYHKTENVNLTMSQDRTDFRELMEVATPEEQQIIISLFNRANEKKKLSPKFVDATVKIFDGN